MILWMDEYLLTYKHMGQTCLRSNSHRTLRPIQTERSMVCPIVHRCTTSIYIINVCWCCHTHTQSGFHFTPRIPALPPISTVQQNVPLSVCDSSHVPSIVTSRNYMTKYTDYMPIWNIHRIIPGPLSQSTSLSVRNSRNVIQSS